MKLYLAGISGAKKWLNDGVVKAEDFNCLESFYSLGEWMRPYIPRFKSFLLDSGAFTFLNSAQKYSSVNWNAYADRYADFIRENGIKRYFELDLDGVIGLHNTERLRARIEARSGVQCIPVWHRARGKDYFLSMVRDYSYVAVGGGGYKRNSSRNLRANVSVVYSDGS